MATLLTTSWKNIGSKTIGNTGYSDIVLRIYAKYSSQSTANNTTSVQRKLVLYLKTGTMYSSGCSYSLTGCSSKSGQTLNISSGEKELLSSASANVTNNNDGSSKTTTLTCSYDIYGKSGSFTAQFTVPKINRLATVSNATDFNDEGNPTISFSNPGGMTARPYLNFYDSSNNLVYSIERSTGVSSPYTWSLNDEEREAMRQATNKQSSYRVQVGIHSYSGASSTGYNSIAKTMTYVNANPTFTNEISELNQKVIDTIGENSNNIIKSVSNIKISVNPTTLKHATVNKIQIIHGNSSFNLMTAPYEQVIIAESNIFEIIVTDSRGFTATGTITKELIDYMMMKINSYSFKRIVPTSSDLYLNASIQYKQFEIDSLVNAPIIQWKKGEEGELQTLTNDDYIVDFENNLITINNLLLSDVIDYTETANLYLYVSDLFSNDIQNMPILVGIPVFDYGEHDFQVNGDLFIADTNRENKINVKKGLRNEILTIGLSSDTNITSTSQYYSKELSLSVETFRKGNMLIHESGKIKIPAGVSKVMVSANCTVNASANTGAWGIRIQKNGTEVACAFANGVATSFHCASISPIGIEVAEKDIIQLGFYINDYDSTSPNAKKKQVKAYNGHGTYLTVDVVE